MGYKIKTKLITKKVTFVIFIFPTINSDFLSPEFNERNQLT